MSILVVSYWISLVLLVACCLLSCTFGLVVIAVSERLSVFYSLFGLRFETNSWPTSAVRNVHVVEAVRKGERKPEFELRNEKYRLRASPREDEARRISEVVRYFFV